MAFADKFHINPATGEVGRCTAEFGKCPFGPIERHFRREDEARRAVETKMSSFEEWTARSNVPQTPGWHTEHVFDPRNPKTYEEATWWLRREVPEGTRLIIENGWILKKTQHPEYWEFIAGKNDDRPSFLRLNRDGLNKDTKFMAALENFGGRLEFTDGIKPMPINWRM